MNPLRAVNTQMLVALVGQISTHVALARASWENIEIREERDYRTKKELIECRDAAKKLVDQFNKAIAAVSKESARGLQPTLPGLSLNRWGTIRMTAEPREEPEPLPLDARERERPE